MKTRLTNTTAGYLAWDAVPSSLKLIFMIVISEIRVAHENSSGSPVDGTSRSFCWAIHYFDLRDL